MNADQQLSINTITVSIEQLRQSITQIQNQVNNLEKRPERKQTGTTGSENGMLEWYFQNKDWAYQVVKHSSLLTETISDRFWSFLALNIFKMYRQHAVLGECSKKRPGECIPLSFKHALLNNQNPQLLKLTKDIIDSSTQNSLLIPLESEHTLWIAETLRDPYLQYAYVQVELYRSIVVEKVSLFHLQSVLVSDITKHSSPRLFHVLVEQFLREKKKKKIERYIDASNDSENWYNLGIFVYDYDDTRQSNPGSPKGMHTFDVMQHFAKDKNDKDPLKFKFLVFRFLTNGGADHLCVYKTKSICSKGIIIFVHTKKNKIEQNYLKCSVFTNQVAFDENQKHPPVFSCITAARINIFKPIFLFFFAIGLTSNFSSKTQKKRTMRKKELNASVNIKRKKKSYNQCSTSKSPSGISIFNTTKKNQRYNSSQDIKNIVWTVEQRIKNFFVERKHYKMLFHCNEGTR
ncbi:hypothetical protein RFI_19524 [Reticulomyxa filosa]|uniref:SUN domain-containing protein n=1 Tax=Reticulomyxa filosa TaxID=46433 RepID=X6MXI8_RETFI|nr:hypothetical protein RFI_19524 [Reticulomyxa filosa]|eukprot:ETO17790.1 hypothetical protein RFI_19524 [Reticulomyxa filosa]